MPFKKKKENTDMHVENIVKDIMYLKAFFCFFFKSKNKSMKGYCKPTDNRVDFFSRFTSGELVRGD